MDIADVDVFIFDLDGTLTESKSPLDKKMDSFLCVLLTRGKKVAVITGGKWQQIVDQFLNHFTCDNIYPELLYLLPTSGARMRVWSEGKWKEIYAEKLYEAEVKQITEAFKKVFTKVSFEIPKETYGEQIENRGTEVTFSALGQEAPIEKKKLWDPDREKRKEMVEYLERLLPDFEINIGGTTSIDITKKGVDKEYGINRFFKQTGFDIKRALFVGDALFPGGNDFEAVKTGIQTLSVKGPTDLLQKMRRYVE